MNSAVLWTLVNVLPLLGSFAVGADEESVFVMEGDSVTLHTNTTADQQEKIRWYFNNSQIAAIIDGKREICTDEWCEERFRGKLKLDQTGSLTITNTRNTDSGEYQLKVIKNGYYSDKIFSVSVHDQSQTCEDDQCKERFRDRLKLDQTGSLTITNTRTTDSGLYKLKISSISINRTSAVLKVTAVPGSGLSPAVPDSGLSPAVTAVIVVVLVLIAAVAAVFIARKCKSRRKKKETQNKDGQGSHLEEFLPPQDNASDVTN